MKCLSSGITIIVYILLFSKYEAAAYSYDKSEDNNEGPVVPLVYRLPKTIIPVEYDIMLSPTLKDDFSFGGTSHINAFVQEATNIISIHVGKLSISSHSIIHNNAMMDIIDKYYNEETEIYLFKLDKMLNVGSNISINFEYSGILRDDMIGFYRSSYINSDGNIRWLAATQFQTTHARHAFPCFDEPSFKAKFVVRILRPPDYATLSNMPLNITIPVIGTNLYWDEYRQSIPMPTYLVAFIVSDFQGEQGKKNFIAWARPNAIEQVKYAVTIGEKGLDALSNLFKQKYQLPKMDMVAVPDFSAGAMENWGLITYRETRMLYDRESSSDAAQQSVASVIVHELTHMWFGNMVTPEWWSYLWLSEGFARYFQYFGTALIEKSWNMEEQFVVEQHQTALAADAVETSQPMTRNVSNTSQIDSVGDTITYNKGASIVRMMSLTFGSDVFHAGLENYLENNKEAGVARPQNLWTELQIAINRGNVLLPASVDEIMLKWTEQSGYPVVNVFIENGIATVKQQRFLLRNLKSTPTNVMWWVPLTWTCQNNANFNEVKPKYWLNREQDTIEIDNSSGWIIFNVQSAGFYRVNYNNASWYRIIDALNSRKYQDIHILNRAALIDDALNLARAGLLPYTTALDGLQYLIHENNYLPFKAAFSGLTYLDQRLSGYEEYYQQFKKFVLILIEDVYKEIGYLDRSTDDRLTVLLRSELNKLACNYGHKGCLDTFTKLFRSWRTNTDNKIEPNQKLVAYCTGVKYGTKEDWDFLWSHYVTSNSAIEQAVILQALGCSEEKDTLEKFLLRTFEGFERSKIRKQDLTSVFSAVYNTGLSGADLVLNFIAKYQSDMVKYHNGTGTISSILSSASQRFSTQKLVDQFEKLIEARKVEFKSILNSLQNSLDIAKYELQWFEKFKDSIASWIISFNDKHSRPNPDDNNDTTEYILPRKIIPRSYVIAVKPHINESEDFKFEGNVKISAEVVNETQTITLHSEKLTHSRINVSVGDTEIEISKIGTIEKYSFLVIELKKVLEINQKIMIDIEYIGYLNDEMRGFYRSSYMYGSEKRWLAATHMEPVAARKMFPCFDEPSLKAKFTIQVTVPRGYGAISNMPIEKQELQENGQTNIVFQQTPNMSTYLVALVVSDFASLQHSSGPYRVWARPNGIKDAVYSLSVMKPLVQFYENALQLDYVLPKLDMVALPDFASGAMENWGLLTYKERNLLYNSTVSSVLDQQSIINVISHEIAHQWFGNIVSPQWWKYLWLNEGFARYFQYFGTASINSLWSLEGQFVVDQLHSAFQMDASESSHAMTHDVYSPTQIRAIFDAISYAKAASVLRMVQKSFGKDVFYKALQKYLNRRLYDVATPKDLFNAFKEEIGDAQIRNIFDNIMNTWTTQPGYPVVHVSLQDQRLRFKQERFFIERKGNASTIWFVPLTWTSVSEADFNSTTPKYWLSKKEENVTFAYDDQKLYLFNVQQTGYYRMNYDPVYWQRIVNFLKNSEHEKIHNINRASLIDDLMNLGRAGYVDYDIVLNATQYLIKEKDYIPWKAFFNGLTFLKRQLREKDAYTAFTRYVHALLIPIYTELGFNDRPNDSHVTKLFRIHVRKWACEFIFICEIEALRYFIDGSIAEIPPNVRGATYCTAAKKEDFLAIEKLWKRFREVNNAAEKSVILASLACSTNKVVLNALLTSAIEKDSGIRFEDSVSVFSNVLDSGAVGVETVMKFMTDNYNQMVAYYKSNSNIKSIVSAIGKRLYTEQLYQLYDELIKFLGEKDSSLKNSLASIKSQADSEFSWAEKYVPKIHAWLDTNYPDIDYNIPSLYSPKKYNLTLSPRFEESNFTFSGNVQIEMTRLMNLTSRIVLNAQELEIKNVRIYESSGNLTKGDELEVRRTLQNNITQKMTIHMKNFIKSNLIMVDIEFTGHLNDNMEGFYRSYYSDAKGNLHWLAATQFEPTYARKVFPCFDEPAFKASFIIHIEKPKDYTALSNMPTLKTTSSNVSDRVWVSFEETVNMSSYLVAFVVCDFEKVDSKDTHVNVWGRPDVVRYGDLAQTSAKEMLNWLYRETGHKYTLPKLDLIGIPDFSMGAMENWGLATFREYGLFYNENKTSAKYTNYIYTIIAHELSHMWYGNLVTCAWWDYIWLNEGFAEYMQWRIADLIAPSHHFNEMFVVDELQSAMQFDATSDTHPLNKAVFEPSDIAGIFDTITYGKGSSILRMLHKSLKPGVFSDATHEYLEKHKYNIVYPDDLWQAFDSAINKSNAFDTWSISMKKLMDTWTNKQGFPLVHAILNENRLTLTQREFSFAGSGNYGHLYYIPITMASASKPDFTTTWTNLWLETRSLDIAVKKPHEWFILNVQQSGYYRVNYDQKSWGRLIEALSNNTQHSNIHVTNRAQIIDDLFNLARANYVDYELVLNATTYLIEEREYPPWKAFFNGISYIAQRYEGQKNQTLLGKYIMKLTSNVYNKTGFVDTKDEVHYDQLNRELFLIWNCKFEESRCVAMAKKLFKNTTVRMSPNSKAAVYCTMARIGTNSDWKYMWNEYLITNFASDKKVILDALGCSTNKITLQWYIQQALTSKYVSNIRKQDRSAALASIYNAGKFGVDTMLDFLISDYEKVYSYYGNWKSVTNLFSKVASRISTSDQINKLKEFAASKKDDIWSDLKSAVSKAEDNYSWYLKHSPSIDTLLEKIIRDDKNDKGGTSTLTPQSFTIITIISIVVYIFSQ